MPERPSPFFVGDHRALDFLNSIATPKDVPVEWLRDGRDLVDWLEEANLISVDVAARFRASQDQRALDGVAGKARGFGIGCANSLLGTWASRSPSGR